LETIIAQAGQAKLLYLTIKGMLLSWGTNAFLRCGSDIWHPPAAGAILSGKRI